ncbi:glucose-1-phosphate cytidylyltransferase [Polynucleobacter antarcticus]|uniref:Glucose-1-phosphate cytidylyltransferase n=1 Tax=Polynucleobacter antarcticus TaxID=1743162 RepID=A0A6M9PT03_9BURK|nr:glucose-1-phosphate cytidylyltransferase [Polynucleobacter antarcticus]QKM61905.1 glucose-1-phosphate cytidylyltransferase [Polynucleobacter antarcticus]
MKKNKVLILAGGLGTRLSEETDLRPKPMVEIGGRPMLWHIMKLYSRYGFNDFVVLLGFKGYFIKEYFSNYFLHRSDITIDLSSNQLTIHNNQSEPWKITLIDTGEHTMTGGRIKRAQDYIGQNRFMLTYGDGLSDIDMRSELEFHESHGKSVTMISVQPDGRFGTFEADSSGLVSRFLEKPKGDGSWINGGFFICEPKVFDYLNQGDATVFEQTPLQQLANEGELYSYRHSGFWKCMDTLRDKNELNAMWNSGNAPWKTW